MEEEWIQYHRLQPSYNEFEFRNGQVRLGATVELRNSGGKRKLFKLAGFRVIGVD